MNADIRCALLADGGRDRVLQPVLTWTLRRHRPDVAVKWVGFEKRVGALRDAIRALGDRYSPDVLFVHRDAEGEPLAVRLDEIGELAGVVRVVPVRMTEAWLLIDERAIRTAAGRPSAGDPVNLPGVSRLESLPNPKKALHEAHLAAAGHPTGRRHRQLLRDEGAFAHRVAGLIADFTLLLELPAFAALDGELQRRLRELEPDGAPTA